jgi:putative ABC transport system substrate-binding protein
MTTRRKLLIAIGTGLVVLPFPSRAQKTAKISHIGYLSAGTLDTNDAFLGALRDALRDLGYIDGKNIVIDVRWAGDAAYLFPQMAASLVQGKPSAIVTTCIPSTRAAKGATGTIPVVMSVDGDPVDAKLVASLARPGGNVTGEWTLFDELIVKWLELLHIAVPNVRDVAILFNPDNLLDPYWSAQFEEAAQRVGVKALRFEARTPADLDRAFADMKTQSVGGLVINVEAFLASQAQRIVSLGDRYKLPTIYGFREFTDAGGLMSYGISFRDYYKRVARYVDLVLKGAKPADLPVERPTKIELVINLKTAKALGLTIPQSLLLRADEVIQ